MSGLPGEVSRALGEAARALCESRSHVVLVAEASVASGLPRLLAAELDGSVPVKLVNLDARSQLGTIESVLAGFESSLVLLIPDALALDPAVLRRIGELSSRASSGLRVALFASRSNADVPDPAAELVQALGTGAEKIEIGADRTARPERPEVLLAPEPPLAAPPRRSRARPIAVRSTTRARQRARRRHAPVGRLPRALLLLGAPIAVWLASGPVNRVEVAAAPPAEPAVSLPVPTFGTPVPPPRVALHEDVIAAEEPAAPLEPQAPSQPEESLADPLPEPDPEPEPEPAVVRTIPVSLNADPWAEIEIDGVPLGPTPIADWPLTPGRHTARASFPDGTVVERSLRVDSVENHFRIR